MSSNGASSAGDLWRLSVDVCQLPSSHQQIHELLSKPLERIKGGLAGCSILGPSQTLACRNCGQFESVDVQLGYVTQGSHEIADVTHHPVLSKVNQGHLGALRKAFPNSD